MVFEVSLERTRTFDNFSRSGSGRWATHEIIGQKPFLEFLGPGQEEISFTVRLDASQGVNPEEELKKLRKMRDSGEIAVLIIGGQPVTENFWVLESLQEQQKVFNGDGKLILASVELTLKEYSIERWVWWLYMTSRQKIV